MNNYSIYENDKYMAQRMVNIAIEASRIGFSYTEWQEMSEYAWKSLQCCSEEKLLRPLEELR